MHTKNLKKKEKKSTMRNIFTMIEKRINPKLKKEYIIVI